MKTGHLPEQEDSVYDLVAAIASLGPVCEYRGNPEKLQDVVKLFEKALETMRAEFEREPDEAERMRYAWDRTRELLQVAWERRGLCMDEHIDVACENTDLLDVVLCWISYVRGSLADASS